MKSTLFFPADAALSASMVVLLPVFSASYLRAAANPAVAETSAPIKAEAREKVRRALKKRRRCMEFFN
jgi:hypothetical protein